LIIGQGGKLAYMTSSNASLILSLYVKAALSLSQLRLVPKVGQWGQLDVRVFRYNILYN
jgi:hypothetical protein